MLGLFQRCYSLDLFSWCVRSVPTDCYSLDLSSWCAGHGGKVPVERLLLWRNCAGSGDQNNVEGKKERQGADLHPRSDHDRYQAHGRCVMITREIWHNRARTSTRATLWLSIHILSRLSLLTFSASSGLPVTLISSFFTCANIRGF